MIRAWRLALALLMAVTITPAASVEDASATHCPFTSPRGPYEGAGGNIVYGGQASCDLANSMRVDIVLRKCSSSTCPSYSIAGSRSTGWIDNKTYLMLESTASYAGCGGYYQTEVWGYSIDVYHVQHVYSGVFWLVNPACSAPAA